MHTGLFEDIDPRLLLFLRKLRCIALGDARLAPPTGTKDAAASRGDSAAFGRWLVMGKREVGDHVVELVAQGSEGRALGAGRWLVVRERLVPQVPR